MFRVLSILSALLLIVTLTKGDHSAFKAVAESCRTEQQITEVEHMSLENWQPNMSAATVDRRLKCYLDCVLQGMEVMDATGQLDLDKYMAYGIVDESMRNGVSACRLGQAGLSDPCEYAFGIYNCVMALRN
ncbi:Odorant-binding protein 57d [Drosophila willistoni]|uniref:Odorant-binding protein 57d n=1 Tax=Drosophila willistoni TaxID=7260 RepID=B4MKE8_DROWI|nr:general odorant-binding protein 57e [Drosophila willistoni]EDW72587.2 Odorant-binding protein 57d [Drosophila willistoni]